MNNFRGQANNTNVEATRKEKATVDGCGTCDSDLTDREPLESFNRRIVEDIPDDTDALEIIEVELEKKYCPDRRTVVTAKSELALPKADIGLNANVLICYLWVALCLPLTKIKEYLGLFFGLKISTAGLSRHAILVAGKMKHVHEKIPASINNAATPQADETGWRVRGGNWRLWVFGTRDAACFTVDKQRDSSVVRRVLGEIFMGVLVVDGWGAFLKLICSQQNGMAHLSRKTVKFRDAFPHLENSVRFYLKLRGILRGGERLQEKRPEFAESIICLSPLLRECPLFCAKMGIFLRIAVRNPVFGHTSPVNVLFPIVFYKTLGIVAA